MYCHPLVPTSFMTHMYCHTTHTLTLTSLVANTCTVTIIHTLTLTSPIANMCCHAADVLSPTGTDVSHGTHALSRNSHTGTQYQSWYTCTVT